MTAAPTGGDLVARRYELEAVIGEGGMARVWSAHDLTLARRVAVKFLFLREDRDRRTLLDRFLREARIAASVRHPNVVDILDFGTTEEGRPFMVMELLEGMSLADRFDNGPKLDALQLLDIVSKVLSGLAVVHDSGIVHRDIKPDNIFLVSDADGEYPKLLDFGISRGLDPKDTRVTNTGAVIGTPLYMSPEQARGMKDVDPRTDLWSVGMILWEGLTGFLPFESEHMGDVLIRIATEDAPSIGDYRDDLPAELVDLIGKVLQRDRDARFTSARAMRDAVLAAADRIAAGAGTPLRRDHSTARLPSPIEQARTAEIAPAAPKRSRWPLLVGIGAALSALVVGFVALGGEIRFSSASAEPEPVSEAPADPPAPAVEAPAEPEPVEAAPAEPEPVEPEPVEPAEAASAEAAQAEEPPAEEPPEVAAPERAPSRAGTRRPPRRSAQTEQAPRAQPEETPATAGRPTKRESTREGGFLRDLDY